MDWHALWDKIFLLRKHWRMKKLSVEEVWIKKLIRSFLLILVGVLTLQLWWLWWIVLYWCSWNVNRSCINWSNRKGRSNSLLILMNTFDFALTLHLMKKVLDISNELSQALQRKDKTSSMLWIWLTSQRSNYKL